MKRKKCKADWIVGGWRASDSYRDTLFTIEKTTKGFRVEAIDESDGEKLVVSKVKWDGKVLSFETLTPSNNWRTRNQLQVISNRKAVHELTFWESWNKVSKT
jgi:hypothetical protein